MVAGRGGVAHFSRRRQGQRPTWTTVVICEDEPLGSDSLPAYVIPRGDRYVVGGTYWELTLMAGVDGRSFAEQPRQP